VAAQEGLSVRSLAGRCLRAAQALAELQQRSGQLANNVLFRFDSDWKFDTAELLARLRLLGDELQAAPPAPAGVAQRLRPLGTDLVVVSETYTEALERLDASAMRRATRAQRAAAAGLRELASELVAIGHGCTVGVPEPSD